MKKIILAFLTAVFSLSFANAQEVAPQAIPELTETNTIVSAADTIAPVENLIEPETAAPQVEPELTAETQLDSSIIDTVKTRPLMLGVSAGVNLTNYSGDVEGASFGTGFQIAFGCDVPIGVNLLKGYLSINPEMNFAYKTVGLDANFLGIESTDRFWSMNIPVHAKWNRSLGSGFLTVAAGPMLNVYLGGSNKWKKGIVIEDIVSGKTTTVDQMLLFQSDPDAISELDFIRDYALYNVLGFALNFKVGYDFASGISINAGYQLGLSNMTNKEPYDAWNKALKLELDEQVKAETLTPEERDKEYKEFKMDAPVLKNGSIFLTIGYVF